MPKALTLLIALSLPFFAIGDGDPDVICIGNMCFPADAAPASVETNVICVGNMCFPADAVPASAPSRSGSSSHIK